MDIAKEVRAFSEGSLVILSIGKKSWSTRLTLKDLGLEKLPENWKPGRKLLLPEEALNTIDSIEGKARRHLDASSFQFGKAQARVRYRFVHLKKLYDTYHMLEIFREAYFDAVKELIAQYEDLKKTMEATYPEQWPSLREQYPPSNEILENYYFTIETVEMVFPNAMTAMKKYELQEADARLKAAEVAHADNLEELRKQTQEHRDNLERMEKEQRASAEARIEQLLDEAVRALRSKVVDTFREITDKIRDKKSVLKSNMNSITDVIAYVKEMDFLDDASFHAQLDQVRELLDRTSEFKDNEAATAELDKLLSSTVEFVQKTTDEAVASAKKTYFARKLAL